MEKGDYGPEGKAFMGWFLANKKWFGVAFGAGAYAAHSLGYDQVASGITAVSGFLLGGGLVKSDQFYKDRQ